MKVKGISMRQRLKSRPAKVGDWMETYAVPGSQRTIVTFANGKKRRYRGWASKIEDTGDGLVDVTMDGLERVRGLRR